MPALQLWIVFNKKSGRVDIIKTRKKAERVAATYNKLFKLLSISESAIPYQADSFFNTHSLDKENTFFSWNIKPPERMQLYQQFFKGGS